MHNIIPIFVIIPLAGAFLTSLIGKKVKGVPDMLGNLSTACLLIASLLSISFVSKCGVLVYKVGAWVPPIGITMVMDGFTSFMLVTVNLVAFLVTVYSVNYMEKFTSKWTFYTLFLLMLAGMNGVIVTGDMFNLFVFMEIASVASYALVAFGTEEEELEASFKYLIMSTVGSLFVLLGIVFMYSYTSTLNMADMAAVLTQKGAGNITLFTGVLFLMGFGLKAAIVPFHAWLPDAHPSAPAPISAMLSGVLIKSLGIYTIARIFYNVFGMGAKFTEVLLIFGALSMVVGALLASGQWDFKRLLAYSSISQIGYIILGLAIGTPLAILGALFHLFNHSVFKSLLFLNSGALEYATGTRDMRLMGGLKEKMPVTGRTSFIASMSIAGVPPFNGFFSKLIIIFAAVQAGYIGYAFLAALVSVVTLAYFATVQKNVFFGSPSGALTASDGKVTKKWDDIKEPPVFMKVPVIILAIICIFGGLLIAPRFSQNFLKAATDALMAGKDYAATVFGGLGL
ncbi:MAG: NADH/ubiquinone/plastoquinone (complex I) [Candidatus Omnitrophica bacterium]|nr:NADH/ubiquinone/plastoquinone (complex I) [Candidatus Omnitrophota bacterium]